MAKVTFLIGLDGSGKSDLADQLQNETGAEILGEAEGDENSELTQAIARSLKEGKNCVVKTISYCYPFYRKNVVNYLQSRLSDIEVEFICFEKDLENANRNIRRRSNEEDVEGIMYRNLRYHDIYEYPADAKILPVARMDE